ncbi:MmgE/PrpD family protein [Patescibacteria group bacterium]|nr:MmgE/PrpD family protein [Patescibacteria group bacterium]
MQYTKRLAEFVLDTRYEDIPVEAFRLAKRHFLDCTGSCLAAVSEKPGKIVYDYIKELQSDGSTRVIGFGLRTSIDNAAFANGILSHAICFDDSGPSHPSVTVVPPLYALGETYRFGGKQILTAQVLGYEVFQKLNLVTKDAWEMRVRGWHPTGFFGAVTSALISSKLLNLTLEQSLNAVGIAASMGAGLSQNIGNMTMSLHAGNASRNGIIAAKLAKEGFTGDQEILEGRFGLMNALAGVNSYDIEALVKNLGNPYSVVYPGINFKPYPNCWAHHRVYDSMLYLVNSHDIKPENVESIWCDLQPDKPTYRYLQPKTELEARYSLGYGIAMCLLDRKLEFGQYLPERITDEKTLETMAKIKHVPQTIESEKHKIVVKLINGAEYSHVVEYSKGNAACNPLSDQELQEKYRYCARRVLPNDKIERSLEMICRMEEISDITEIVDAITQNETLMTMPVTKG